MKFPAKARAAQAGGLSDGYFTTCVCYNEQELFCMQYLKEGSQP